MPDDDVTKKDLDSIERTPPPSKAAPKRRKRRIIILSALAAVLIFFVATVEITSTSGFCSVCHYMKPFFESWKTSTHSEIQCKVCHYPPGVRSFFRTKIEGLVMVARYWTKLYVKSKPWAEIQDESCLRPGCHDRRLLEGSVPFKDVHFDHKAHFNDLKRGKQLRCTSCHSQIVQGEHITVTAESCFLCHFKDKAPSVIVDECAVCHRKDELLASKERFDHSLVYDQGYRCDKCHSRIVSGTGDVPRENCYKCHFERDRLERYGDTELMHRTHIAVNKIECEQCHSAIQHRIVKDIETIADCQACHTGTHQAQKILYTGEGGKGVDHPMPNLMLEKGLSCQGCHIFHEQSGQLITSDTLAAGAGACESCHGQGFDRILRNWEASTRTRLSELTAIYRRAEAEIRSSKAGEEPASLNLLKEARFNIDLVDKGKSVHNMAYSQELLAAALGMITNALKNIGSSWIPEAPSLLTRESPNACLNCHAGIEELPASVFGLGFSHKTHAVQEKMDCGACHSNASRHGELTASKTSCATCHHASPQKACGGCHALQKTIFEGGFLGDLQVPQDIMSEAETSCKECHLDKTDKVIRPDAGPCVSCHDENYRETFKDWQETVRARIDEIRTALHKLYKTPLTDAEKADLRKIESGFLAIENDGSSGIHNFPFIEEFLTKTLGAVNSLIREKEGEK